MSYFCSKSTFLKTRPMPLEIRFNINNSLYLRDPQDTELGRKILEKGILLINEFGLEAFNFKKLADHIESTEASIYRYFENKHMLLLFLTSWYYEWVNYLIKINTRNIEDPIKRLEIAINNIVNASTENPLTAYINEELLNKIVIKEGSKAYHTVSIDDENKSGFFLSYKNVVGNVAKIVGEISPNFPYKYSLVSNMFEMANTQIYFADHLPRLTDIKKNAKSDHQLEKMIKFFVFKLLE